jgi:hypothetical protein
MFEPSDVSQAIRIMAGLATAAYIFIYAVFMIGHTPRAVPIKEGALKGRWRSDKSSAYRPWLFALAFLANALTVTLLLMMGGIIFAQVGWAEIPLALRLVVLFSLVPYGIALMDGLINSRLPSVTSLLTLLWATPCYLLASTWFSVWLPAYASARISDLSWGNRDNDGDDQSSEVAKHRANVGRLVTMTLILSNVIATGASITLNSIVTGALQLFLVSCIGVMGINFGLAGVDILIRFFRKLSIFVMCWCCIPGFDSSHDQDEEEKDEKEEEETKRTINHASDSTMAAVHSEDSSNDDGIENLDKSF